MTQVRFFSTDKPVQNDKEQTLTDKVDQSEKEQKDAPPKSAFQLRKEKIKNTPTKVEFVLKDKIKDVQEKIDSLYTVEQMEKIVKDHKREGKD